MSKNLLSRVYIVSVAVSAILLSVLAVNLFPWVQDLRFLWVGALLIGLVALADRFPIKLSPQAEATLSIVPLFMAVLILEPIEAIIVAILGKTASELMLKAPLKAMIFNVSVYTLAVSLSAVTYFSLKPEGVQIALTGGHMLAAGVSAVVLHESNVFLVVGMITIRKGKGFWKSWANTYVFEAIQEGGLLVMGLLMALLFVEAWWSIVLVLVPCALAYYGFNRTVSETAEKARLAEQLEENLKELKAVQAQLIQAAKLASVGTLAAGVAHEINNPLFALSGRAELLLRSPEKHLRSDKALEYVKVISDMGARISKIVSQLLEYARPSNEEKEVNINEVIEGALGLLSSKADARYITFVREYDHAAPVKGVSGQLQQVFVNLISNSIDAIGERGSITVGCRQDGSMVEAYVKDTGCGIPEDIINMVFEPFFTTKEVGKGTGLGLFVCHKIVKAHRGDIYITSEVGKGTTVWLKLPTTSSSANETEITGPQLVEVGGNR